MNIQVLPWQVRPLSQPHVSVWRGPWPCVPDCTFEPGWGPLHHGLLRRFLNRRGVGGGLQRKCVMYIVKCVACHPLGEAHAYARRDRTSQRQPNMAMRPRTGPCVPDGTFETKHTMSYPSLANAFGGSTGDGERGTGLKRHKNPLAKTPIPMFSSGGNTTFSPAPGKSGSIGKRASDEIIYF